MRTIYLRTSFLAIVLVAAMGLSAAAWHRRACALELEKRSLPVDAHGDAGGLDEPDALECYEGIITRSPPMRAVIATLYQLDDGLGPGLPGRHLRSGLQR